MNIQAKVAIPILAFREAIYKAIWHKNDKIDKNDKKVT